MSSDRVGITASCFDLFHAGHVLMLQEAKEQCDRLVVALQTDPTIDRPEKNKPVQSVFERWVQLEGCKYVDTIIPYTTEEDLLDILKSYDWDVRIIGSEYYGKEFTGHDLLDIEIYYNSRRHDFSTTNLRKKIENGTKTTTKEI
jgi:glycerol-3-phosphate cytidylyltransferase